MIIYDERWMIKLFNFFFSNILSTLMENINAFCDTKQNPYRFTPVEHKLTFKYKWCWIYKFSKTIKI